MSGREENCGTCKYRKADERPEYAGSGLCRRFPPIIVEQVSFDGSGFNNFSQHWPWMNGSDWCGEYREFFS